MKNILHNILYPRLYDLYYVSNTSFYLVGQELPYSVSLSGTSSLTNSSLLILAQFFTDGQPAFLKTYFHELLQ